METKGTIQHFFPVWRDHSDFIIFAELNASDVPENIGWEQLWARQISKNRFEICCIPFFTYGLRLGDEVVTSPKSGHTFVVTEVVKQSDLQCMRLWFRDEGDVRGIALKLQQDGVIVETRGTGSRLIAIATPPRIADMTKRTIALLVSEGVLSCESVD